MAVVIRGHSSGCKSGSSGRSRSNTSRHLITESQWKNTKMKAYSSIKYKHAQYVLIMGLINNNNDESSTNLINTANASNTYFTAVADTLLTKNFFEMDTNNNDDPITYLRQNFKYCQSQIKLKNSTTHEMDKIIKSLKNKTSHGYDEISDKILKASAPFILSPLTYTV